MFDSSLSIHRHRERNGLTRNEPAIDAEYAFTRIPHDLQRQYEPEHARHRDRVYIPTVNDLIRLGVKRGRKYPPRYQVAVDRALKYMPFVDDVPLAEPLGAVLG